MYSFIQPKIAWRGPKHVAVFGFSETENATFFKHNESQLHVCLSDWLTQTHRRLPLCWRHCLLYMSHNNPRRQFRRRRLFSRWPQFYYFCVFYVCIIARTVQKRIPRNYFRFGASMWALFLKVWHAGSRKNELTVITDVVWCWNIQFSWTG